MQCSTHCRPSLLLPTLLSLCFVKSINSRGRLGPAKSAFDNLIWVLPRIWCNSRRLGDRCEVKRRVWKDASAQEREARTAKHLALESFQAVDLSFHLAVAPGSLHSGQDRREVLLKTTAKRATGPIPECLAFFIQTNKDWPSPHRRTSRKSPASFRRPSKSGHLAESWSSSNCCSAVNWAAGLVPRIAACFGVIFCGRAVGKACAGFLHPATCRATMPRPPRLP